MFKFHNKNSESMKYTSSSGQASTMPARHYSDEYIDSLSISNSAKQRLRVSRNQEIRAEAKAAKLAKAAEERELKIKERVAKSKANIKAKAMSKVTDEDLLYTPHFPIEQRKAFWKYGLNPITGMPPEKSLYVGPTETPTVRGMARCNGTAVY